jgi:hypothetical protein
MRVCVLGGSGLGMSVCGFTHNERGQTQRMGFCLQGKMFVAGELRLDIARVYCTRGVYMLEENKTRWLRYICLSNRSLCHFQIQVLSHSITTPFPFCRPNALAHLLDILPQHPLRIP